MIRSMKEISSRLRRVFGRPAVKPVEVPKVEPTKFTVTEPLLANVGDLSAIQSEHRFWHRFEPPFAKSCHMTHSRSKYWPHVGKKQKARDAQ